MKFKIIILTGILTIFSHIAYAEDFILPQSFSIDQSELPQLEQSQSEQKVSSEKTEPAKTVFDSIRKTPQQPVKPVITDVSLTELVKNFSYDYSKTLRSTMQTLTQFNIKPLCYDSSKGQIRAELNTGKELFILLLPSRQELTHVRITPADGNYNISRELVNDIFKNIERNLYSDIN